MQIAGPVRLIINLTLGLALIVFVLGWVIPLGIVYAFALRMWIAVEFGL